MTYLEKLKSGQDVVAKIFATWGPQTEFGNPVKLSLDVRILRKGGNADYSLSICGGLKIKKCDKLGLKPVNTGGQCQDSMVSYLADSGLKCSALDKIIPIWNEWHLNDCVAGTERQEKCLKNYKRAHPDWNWDYDGACRILREYDLFEDKQHIVNGEPYQYGTAWLLRKIPNEILEELCGILDSEFTIETIKKEQ